MFQQFTQFKVARDDLLLSDFLAPVASMYKYDGLSNPLIKVLFSIGLGIVTPSIEGFNPILIENSVSCFVLIPVLEESITPIGLSGIDLYISISSFLITWLFSFP